MKQHAEITYDQINENQEYNEIINKVINECFSNEGLDKLNIYISITLTNPEVIHKLNKEYRNVDRATDVLSFPMFEKNEIEEMLKEHKIVESSIAERAKEDCNLNCEKNGNSNCEEKENGNSNCEEKENQSSNNEENESSGNEEKLDLNSNKTMTDSDSNENFNECDVLGDLVISIPKVYEQAEEYGHSFERELAYMCVHGFYHLMGYDHIIESDKVIMRKKEDEILNKLGITREG
jgi:probable rRNA maturation factor